MFFRKHATKLELPSVLVRPVATPRYTAAFAPAGFTAYAMNNAGNVVGATDAGAAIWSRRRVTTVLPNSTGRGINQRGDIVGDYFDGTNTMSFVRTRAGVRYIRLERYEEYCYGIAINASGQVAGNGHAPAGEGGRGFLESRGVATLIDSFGGDWSNAKSINNPGHVVGTAAWPDQQIGYNHHHAYVFRDGVREGLGTLGGRNSEGWDINDVGQIVGAAETEIVPEGEYSPVHLFVYEGGSMRDLGRLAGDYTIALAINNAGVVVGHSGAAFIYLDGAMVDLNTLVSLPEGFSLSAAIDINDAGQILARTTHTDGGERWVRLSPTTA